jgi:23S rRNA pseudouridine2605 synthase
MRRDERRPERARKPPKEAKKRTLDRILSKGGAGSRTEASQWIRAGRVRVEGRVVRDPETWVDPGSERVELDGEPLRAPRPVYLLLCKPRGVVTTARDPAGRKTVFDLLPEQAGHLFTVGRLDLDTSGLLLLTNDSQLAERLTNPDHEVPKTYLVKASCRLGEEQLEALRRGVDLPDGRTKPAEVTLLREPGGRSVFELTLREGRNRQVRRMVEAVGSKVLKLVRVRIGPLELQGMQPGDWRELTPAEIAALKGAAGRR